MSIIELQNKIAATVDRIREMNQNPCDIPVTLQLEGGQDYCGHTDMDVVWDNNTQATGCVIVATINEETS